MALPSKSRSAKARATNRATNKEQKPPLEEAALLEVLRTADCLSRSAQRVIRPWGITSTQYNVLRILRGARKTDGATCSEVAERMITADPDITRLLERLKRLGYIDQQRDKTDRRAVRTQITPKGLELLSGMDAAMRQLPVSLLGHMTRRQLETLCRLLAASRQNAGVTPLPGKEKPRRKSQGAR